MAEKAEKVDQKTDAPYFLIVVVGICAAVGVIYAVAQGRQSLKKGIVIKFLLKLKIY